MLGLLSGLPPRVLAAPTLQYWACRGLREVWSKSTPSPHLCRVASPSRLGPSWAERASPGKQTAARDKTRLASCRPVKRVSTEPLPSVRQVVSGTASGNTSARPARSKEPNRSAGAAAAFLEVLGLRRTSKCYARQERQRELLQTPSLSPDTLQLTTKGACPKGECLGASKRRQNRGRSRVFLACWPAGWHSTGRLAADKVQGPSATQVT